MQARITSDNNLKFPSTIFSQLMDYKSSLNKATSMLDYLTRVIITKCPHIAALGDDLRHVEKASKGEDIKSFSTHAIIWQKRLSDTGKVISL